LKDRECGKLKIASLPYIITRKKALRFSAFFAPAGVEMLILWNDFRKVVKFIDENPWIKQMLAKIEEDENKNRGVR